MSQKPEPVAKRGLKLHIERDFSNIDNIPIIKQLPDWQFSTTIPANVSIPKKWVNGGTICKKKTKKNRNDVYELYDILLKDKWLTLDSDAWDRELFF